ncbi:MAG: TolC family protein [Pseudomonadota bacterium]
MKFNHINRLFFGFILFALLSPTSQAKRDFTVAVLSDLGASQSTALEAHYVEELHTLTRGEFDVTVLEYEVDWRANNFNQQVDKIYRDPKVDMLLVLGFAANQITIRRDNFPKPTFLPFVVESELIGAPLKDGASGKRNLSYLTFSTQFVDSLVILSDVVKYSTLAIIADDLVISSLPDQMQDELLQESDGLTARLVAHDGQDHNILDRIGGDVDAVMIGHLPRMPDAELQQLIDGLIERKLPGFTYLGDELVNRGLLASPVNRALLIYAARRNALNMQAVMLGEPASQLPVLVDIRPKLTINLNTADAIGLAVNFKTLVDADVIGFGGGVNAEKYNLVSLTAAVLEENLEIKNESYNLAIQQNEQNLAKGRLRPQLVADVSQLRRRDDSSAVQSGFLPEETTDASISLSQTLFSDSEFANYKIQSLLYRASSEKYRQTQLDIIQQAALAMADVLQAQSEAQIQRENVTFTERNLELAIDRVKLGAASSADQYRWETQAANARSAVFSAYSRLLSAQHNLAAILNRPIERPIEVEPLALNDVMLYSSDELFELLDNADSFENIYDFGLQEAFSRSPEIKQLEALNDAKRREVKSLARRPWIPEISLSGQVTENIDQTSAQPNGGGEQDWNVMLNARIPFYSGGQIRSQRERAELELAQLDNQLELTKLQISTQLRTNMNALLTALFNLEFTKTAAAAAARSLSLVTDAYAKGAVPIVDLLDAQNSSVNADLAEVQASISFFRSNVQMQRVIGEFEFLMSERQRELLREKFINRLQLEN